jgi:hypothetical protein
LEGWKDRMKKTLILVLALVLVLGTAAFALDKGEIEVGAKVAPYASVKAQKTKWHQTGWFFIIPIGEWQEDEPNMNFQYYSGVANQRKFTDTNCFIVETNAPVDLVFTGTALQHEVYDDSKMLTTYWVFQSWGVDDLPRFMLPPEQILPKWEIGYFADLNHALLYETPWYSDHETEFVEVPEDALLALLGLFKSGRFYPTAGAVAAAQETSIDREGIYAYQVFGFAGTGGISDQRAGHYTAEITLTVNPQ